LSFSAISIELRAQSAISLVTLSLPTGRILANFITPSSKTLTHVVAAQISIHTTQSSFCLFERTDSGAVRRLG